MAANPQEMIRDGVAPKIEINPPFANHPNPKMVQGGFWRDDAGQTWLFHRGRFGGNKPISQGQFLKEYKRKSDLKYIEGNEVILVGKICSESLLARVRFFMDERDRIGSGG